MRPFTLALFGLFLFLVLGSAFWFHHLHEEHLHHVSAASVQLISKKDHDRWLKEGIDCQETYTTQGYEGPEALLRMFSLTQSQFHELNPGTGITEQPQGTVLCIRATAGGSKEVFHWFWPITVCTCVALGAALSWLLRTKYMSSRSAPAAAAKATPDVPQALAQA